MEALVKGQMGLSRKLRDEMGDRVGKLAGKQYEKEMPRSAVMVVLGKGISPKRRGEMIKGLILQIFICLCE